MTFKENLYVTLTYNGFALPYDMSLSKNHVTLYLKRLRKAYEPKRFRYFVCGEYGTKGRRPHYHIALFGIGFKDEEIVREAWKGHCKLYGKKVSWNMGFVDIGFLTDKSAGYISGYVCKGLYQNNDYVKEKLNGRRPEFQIMSRKPGLGAYKARDFASKLGSRDVQVRTIRIGKKNWPVGRYIQQIIDAERCFEGNKYKGIREYYASIYDGRSVEEIMEDSFQVERNLVGKQKIYNRRSR